MVVDTDSSKTTVRSRQWIHRPARQHGPWAIDLDTEKIWSVLGELTQETMDKAKALLEALSLPSEVAAIA